MCMGITGLNAGFTGDLCPSCWVFGVQPRELRAFTGVLTLMKLALETLWCSSCCGQLGVLYSHLEIFKCKLQPWCSEQRHRMILLNYREEENPVPEFSSMYFLMTELHLLACVLSELWDWVSSGVELFGWKPVDICKCCHMSRQFKWWDSFKLWNEWLSAEPWFEVFILDNDTLAM